jgi:peroxiredoxin Q/BCP
MTALAEGGMLPEIDLTASDGSRIELATYRGKPLVVYFYPKDDTAGCTREAQGFSDAYAAFQSKGVAVLGVSRDTPEKHRKFIAKYGLTVPLATADGDAALAAFGVWVEKQLYGKTYMGIDRSTFLFDADGVAIRVWRKVRVPGHVEQVLAAATQLS